MKRLNIKKSNKVTYFQSMLENKVIISIKTNDIENISNKGLELNNIYAEENILLKGLIKKYKEKLITYSTFHYILIKNNYMKKNSKESKSIQLLTEWSKESGNFNPNEFHFRI
jgi:hypothetical protein